MSEGPITPEGIFASFVNHTLDRLMYLENCITEITKILHDQQQRELMFFSELAKEDPEMGEHLQGLMDRVKSYPVDLGQ